MTCPACGSVNVNLVWRYGVVVAYRCGNCWERWERDEPEKEADYGEIR